MATDETLLTASSVKLFGRPVAGITLTPAAKDEGLGGNKFLRQQLATAGAQLARIYGFSHLGRYTALSRATLMLVHGAGQKVNDGTLAGAAEAYGAGALAGDIMVWEYDRADFSLRLDVESGPLERILIEAEGDEGQMPYFRGSKTRLRGPGE